MPSSPWCLALSRMSLKVDPTAWVGSSSMSTWPAVRLWTGGLSTVLLLALLEPCPFHGGGKSTFGFQLPCRPRLCAAFPQLGYDNAGRAQLSDTSMLHGKRAGFCHVGMFVAA